MYVTDERLRLWGGDNCCIKLKPRVDSHTRVVPKESLNTRQLATFYLDVSLNNKIDGRLTVFLFITI